MLQLYNSLHRCKQLFSPRQEGRVSMYVCGMTVYDYCHLGHGRMMAVFDLLQRYLRYQGLQVTYVRNITDVDDKILARAQQRNQDWQRLAQEFIDAMHEDTARLNILPPDIEPKATDHIPHMIKLIERLVAQKIAYVSDNGDVCYRVRSFERYGQLSNKSLDDLQAGSRVAIATSKEDPLDFVLWKQANANDVGWDSPWGRGRPGWHIECSAMSMTHLGEQFDIHGGGLDLKFPHHENEIAQSEACTHKQLANFWLHNGFVQINEEKMSKSLGNFLTLRDLFAHHAPEVVRYFLLASHYRSPLRYDTHSLQQARQSLSRLYNALQAVESVGNEIDSRWQQRFCQAMDDDLNTPAALAVLFELSHTIHSSTGNTQRCLANTLHHLGGVMGLLQQSPQVFLQAGGDQTVDDQTIEQWIAQRDEARQNKDFATADALRDRLQQAGIQLEDRQGKTRWRRQ